MRTINEKSNNCVKETKKLQKYDETVTKINKAIKMQQNFSKNFCEKASKNESHKAKIWLSFLDHQEGLILYDPRLHQESSLGSEEAVFFCFLIQFLAPPYLCISRT